ncbi:MAG: DUF2069 domain-containing protein [Gammaproteobacteria bacterium]|nr:DUF2069 domain-containing protein [Gammaproteobacteria bacterium]MBL6998772.1 DUF2069 domain-containing protein [Gammaproteobacteria bacterium]
MKQHPLKLISLISILSLIICQASLSWWLSNDLRFYIASILTLPLLIPLRGLITDRRYTFKWVGFLTFLYFIVGVSEAFANPDLRVYSTLTISFSCLLFLSSIYYSRYLKQMESLKPS